MPSFCAVINCGNRSNRDKKSFFRLPGNPKRACEARKNLCAERRIRWLIALRRADLNEKKIQYLRICEDHFITGKPSALQDTNNPDWVPSKNMGYETNLDEPVTDEFERRGKKRKFDVDTELPSYDESDEKDYPISYNFSLDNFYKTLFKCKKV